MPLINLKTSANDINKDLINFHDPDECYYLIPKNFTILKEIGDYVYKGEPILINKSKAKIFASISGNYIKAKNLKDKKYLVIKNDYREREKKRMGYFKIQTCYLNKELTNQIKEKNIIAYRGLANNPSKIIVNAIFAEKYEYSYFYLFDQKCLDILETINALVNSYNCTQGILIVSSNYGYIIKKIIDNLGMFPKIILKIMNPLYPLNNNQILRKELGIKKNKNNLFLSFNDVYRITTVLKKNVSLSEKIVVFGGNALKETKSIQCKIGVSLKEVVTNYLEIENSKDIKYYLNGALRGKLIKPDNYFIDYDTDFIVIEKPSLQPVLKCINCGLCSDYCPLKLDPKVASKECLKCGICKYVCPCNCLDNKEELK